MTCVSPLKGYKSRTPNSKGRYTIVFKAKDGFVDLPKEVACGRCIGCNFRRTKEWTVRLVHEASLHERNSFITLTYSPENLPKNGALVKKDFQLFMKRLRKARKGEKIRFFHCGEYGENGRRPHYHAILFNCHFPDATPHGDYKISNELQNIWGKGFVTIGEVNFKTSAYVSKYVTKKISLNPNDGSYQVMDQKGELTKIPHEYCTMSRRPGIGRGWIDKYYEDVFPDDFVVLENRKFGVPRYYLSRYEAMHPEKMNEILDRRLERATKREKIPIERLETLEKIYFRKATRKKDLL